MRFVVKAQGRRGQDVNMIMRGFVKIQTAKILCLRLQCLERIRADVLKFTTGTGRQVNKMSDDLISRKALKQAIDHDFYEHYTKYHDTDQRALIDMVMDDIDEMPVAFDKEKVITEMNETKNIVEAKIKKAYAARDKVSFYLNSGASDMAVEFIDIVEKGGIE